MRSDRAKKKWVWAYIYVKIAELVAAGIVMVGGDVLFASGISLSSFEPFVKILLYVAFAWEVVYWLYRVIFGIPATNLTTKGESIEFSTPSIEGTVTRRNKVDGQGKHPWKAEVSEDDSGVSPTVITGWYDEVYEPSYADQTAGAGGEG